MRMSDTDIVPRWQSAKRQRCHLSPVHRANLAKRISAFSEKGKKELKTAIDLDCVYLSLRPRCPDRLLAGKGHGIPGII
jgi:hypothetical protein